MLFQRRKGKHYLWIMFVESEGTLFFLVLVHESKKMNLSEIKKKWFIISTAAGYACYLSNLCGILFVQLCFLQI